MSKRSINEGSRKGGLREGCTYNKPNIKPSGQNPYSDPIVDDMVQGLTKAAEHTRGKLKLKTTKRIKSKDFIGTKDNISMKDISGRIIQKEPKKVYCKYCKNVNNYSIINCHYITGTIDTPYEPVKQYLSYDSNKNNDCEYYVNREEEDEIDYDYKFFGLIKCKRKMLEIELPKGFMNIAITMNNHLTSNTNNSTNWDTLSFPVPRGIWKIKSIKGKIVTLINLE